jgi:hypothetical protein
MRLIAAVALVVASAIFVLVRVGSSVPPTPASAQTYPEPTGACTAIVTPPTPFVNDTATVTVRLINGFGGSIAGATGTASIVPPDFGATITPAAFTTDANGEAVLTLQAGDEVGQFTVSVVCTPDLTTQAVVGTRPTPTPTPTPTPSPQPDDSPTPTETVEPTQAPALVAAAVSPPAAELCTITVAPANPQADSTATVTVRVFDENGHLMPGVPGAARLEPADFDASISPPAFTTDEHGAAELTLSLGSDEGALTIVAICEAQLNAPGSQLTERREVEVTLPVGGVVGPPAPPAPAPAVQPTPPVVEGSNRPELVRSVLSPADVSLDPGVVATNLTLSGLTLLLIFLAAQLFNSTIKTHKSQVDAIGRRVVAPVRARVDGRVRALARPPVKVKLADRLAWPTVVLGLTVLIYGFADPGFGLNARSAVLALSLLFTVGLVTYVTEGGEAYLTRTQYGLPAGVRPFPVAIGIAIASVVASRLIGFGPGLIYGFVGTAVLLRPSADGPETARTIFIPLLALLALSIAAWLLVIPLRAWAEDTDAAFPAFLEGVSVTLFVSGLQGVFFCVIPLSFMEGGRIWAWDKRAWLLLAGISTLLFWHVLINSNQAYFDALGSTVSVAALIALGVCVALSGGAWLYFWLRARRVVQAA